MYGPGGGAVAFDWWGGWYLIGGAGRYLIGGEVCVCGVCVGVGVCVSVWVRVCVSVWVCVQVCLCRCV